MNHIALALYNSQSKVEKFLKDRKGASLVEYALLLVAIMILVAAVYKQLGQKVQAAGTSAAGKL